MLPLVKIENQGPLCSYMLLEQVQLYQTGPCAILFTALPLSQES